MVEKVGRLLIHWWQIIVHAGEAPAGMAWAVPDAYGGDRRRLDRWRQR
ncbi:MAG TPA: hypothetical protein VNS22_16545 [Geminicoccus sp.]|nr:hypothetical protein [Geminicoccus sp.]HWL69981.1 hypothetical protein [Geminicoccus sp.]